MNVTSSQVQNIILHAIQNTNQARSPDNQLVCDPAARLYGNGSPLDSLGLVSLLIDIEDSLRSNGINVFLSDERAMSQTRSPFRSVAALVDYIMELIEPQS